MSGPSWWRRLRLLRPLDPSRHLPGWEDLPDRGAPRRLGVLRDRWRWWMAIPLLVLAVAAAAVVPVHATVEEPAVIEDARSLAEVTVEDPGPGRQPGYTGAYLLPRARTSTTALGWATAFVVPGRTLGPAATSRTAQGLRPLDVALLTGAGVAPGRGDPVALGLDATRVAPDLPEDRLGLLLHVADSVHRRDLAAGRRVLALGAITAASTVRCPADPAASVAATTPPPDLVLVGTGCGDGLDGADGVPVVEVGTFTEALVAVANPAGSR